MRRLEDGMFIDGQIQPNEVSELAAQGIKLIVNNRPDGEEPGQPAGAEIEAAASAAGIAYRAIPISQLTPEAIEATRQAFDEAGGPILAFCKSGTRSTYVWALARSLGGADGDSLVAQAAEAGYDLTPIRRFLR